MTITAKEICEALNNRYSAERGWYTATELGSPVSYYYDSQAWPEIPEPQGVENYFRRIDFLAVATWPSLECAAIGFEIKVSRGDFLSEVKSGKYREWMQFCEKFIFATAPNVVYRPEEIPDQCGHVEIRKWGDGYRVKVLKPAPRHQVGLPPWRLFGAVLNRARIERTNGGFDGFRLQRDLERAKEKLAMSENTRGE